MASMTIFILMYVAKILAVVTVTSVLGFIFYLALQHRKYAHLPGPKRDSFFMGHIPTMRRKIKDGKMRCEIDFEWVQEYGPIVCVWMFYKPKIIIADPDVLKKILIDLDLPKTKRVANVFHSIFGVRFIGRGVGLETDREIWRKQREIINPAFYRTFLKNLIPNFNECSVELMNVLSKDADKGKEIDIAQLLKGVALNIIGKVGFNYNCGALQEGGSRFTNAYEFVLNGALRSVTEMFVKYAPWASSFREQVRNSLLLLRSCGKVGIENEMKNLSEGKGGMKNFFSFYLKAAEENPGSITMRDIQDRFLGLFLAGHETTANTMAFIVREVCRHPHMEERLVKEIDEIMEDRKIIEYEDILNMKYLGQLMKEALRLYPIAPGIIRQTDDPVEFNGYIIPAGSEFTISFLSLHRDPKYWEEPMKFDPDRWEPDAKQIHHYAYAPFSLGSRSCAGQTFSQLETKVILGMLYHRFKPTLLPGQSTDIGQVFTLRPKGGVKVSLETRKHFIMK